MVRTQIQLPDNLYKEIKRIADERELSLAELARRGLEYMVSISLPARESRKNKWTLPDSIDLGGAPVATEKDWRELANETAAIPVKKKIRSGKNAVV